MKLLVMSAVLFLSVAAQAKTPALTPECKKSLIANSLQSFKTIKEIRESVMGAPKEIRPTSAQTGQLFLAIMVGTSINVRCDRIESGLAHLRRGEEPLSYERKYLQKICLLDGNVRAVIYDRDPVPAPF